MGQVSIGGVLYDIYGTEAGANTYFAATIDAGSWLTSDSTTKKKALVSATRRIDTGAQWEGARTSGAQPLEFPRTGLTDCYGQSVSSVTVPLVIDQACYELARRLIDDPALLDNPDSGSNVRRLQAGSAAIEYWRPTSGQGSILPGAPRFPQVVHELLKCFLASSGTFSLPTSGGLDAESGYGECDDHDLSNPYA